MTSGTTTAIELNMEYVFAHIERHTVRYQQHPLWAMLKHGDGPESARKKLCAFAPAISHFILAFRDFNDFVVPYENPKTALEFAINNHAIEDSTHFRPFIEDWEKLGGDMLLTPYEHMIPGLPEEDHRVESKDTIASLKQAAGADADKVMSWSGQTFSFLWSDAANRHNRKLLHDYSRLIHVYGDDPVVRFAIIEAGEATGLVMFHTTARLANELSRETGLEYRYFGDYHLALETGHLVNQDAAQISQEMPLSCACEADAEFKSLDLSQAQHEQCIHVVDKVFAMFSEWLTGIEKMMLQSKSA